MTTTNLNVLVSQDTPKCDTFQLIKFRGKIGFSPTKKEYTTSLIIISQLILIIKQNKKNFYHIRVDNDIHTTTSSYLIGYSF